MQLMADIPMPGPVKVAYCRKPDFFKALRVEGRTSQTIIGRDEQNGTLAGTGTRSIKPAYINGEKTNIGYLSSLRVSEAYRGSIHLARGYDVLRELHNDGKALLYLSTILSDNLAARKLTGKRNRLPAYHDIGRFNAMSISLSQKPAVCNAGNLLIRQATREDGQLIIRFLNREGKRRQFFPAYSEVDLFHEKGLLPGLLPEDILLAFRGDRLIGTVAGWDQKAFRRSIVAGYAGWASYFRPFYNLWAKLRGLPLLPPAMSVLNYFLLSLVCIHDDNENVFTGLLNELIARKRKSHSYMMAGMHEHDPLCKCISTLRHFNYFSRLHVVCWPDGEKQFSDLDGRIPYLELGSL